MIDLRSAWAGIRTMQPGEWYRHWFIDRPMMHGFWLHIWTPVWHDGRGPYITCGLWFIRFGRRY